MKKLCLALLLASCSSLPEQAMPNPAYDLALLKIPVQDIEACATFYRDTLGMEQTFLAAEYGWAQFLAGGHSLALYQPGMGGGNGAPGASTGFHLALPPDAFDSVAERLAAAGALEGDQVHQGNDGTTFVEARDPDGNLLKIMRLE